METTSNFPLQGQIIPDKNLVAQTGQHVKWILQAMWWNDAEMWEVDMILQQIMSGVRTDLHQAIIDLEAIPQNKHWNWWHGLEW